MRENIAKAKSLPWETRAAAGLVATVIAPLLAMVLDRGFSIPGLFFTLVSLIMAGLTLLKNRWLIAGVVTFSLAFFAAALRSPIVRTRLVNPTSPYLLVALLHVLGFASAAVTGIIALLPSVLVRQPRPTNRV